MKVPADISTKVNSLTTFNGPQGQWLEPVQLSASGILRLAVLPENVKSVRTILSKLTQDDLIRFMRGYYQQGLDKFGSCWGYVDLWTALRAATRVLKPENYLEIGVRRGASLAMVADSCPKSNLFGFDLWVENYAGMENPGKDFVQAQVTRFDHRGELTLVGGDSKETVPSFLRDHPDLFFDMITVDGDHSEEGARRDIQNIMERLKLGGLLLFDDICHPQHDYLNGVWDDLVGKHEDFESVKYTEIGNGIALAVRKKFSKYGLPSQPLNNSADLLVQSTSESQRTEPVRKFQRTYQQVRPQSVERPRISVITPVKNQDHFLEECIKSVLEQDYPEVEYLIVDGASTDQTVEIIRKYQDHLSYWSSEADGGQAEAINKGLRLTTGNLVAWLNADDYYLPGALSKVAEAYAQQPEASFYFGDGLRVDNKGQTKQRHFHGGELVFEAQALILGLNYILQPATFIQRKYLKEINFVDPTLHYGFDTDLWIRLSKTTSPSPIPALLAASREHEFTKTATGCFQRVEELRTIAAKYSGLPMTPGALCYFLDTLHRMSVQEHAIFPKTFWKEIRKLWAVTASLMQQFGSTPTGFPLTSVSGVDSRDSILSKIVRRFVDFRRSK